MSPEKKATTAAACVAFALILAKLTVGLSTGTVSVLASAVDSLIDFAISFFNLFAITRTEKPSDERYNYGRGKLEGIASLVEGLFIGVSALFIFQKAFEKLFRPESLERFGWSMATMVFSTLATLFLVLYLQKASAKTDSLIVKADLLHYKTDLFSNLGILLALGAIKITDWAWIDPVVGVGIALYILKGAYPLLRNGVFMLMDHALEPDLVERIRTLALSRSPRITGVHEVKTRRSGNTYFVDMHIVLDEEIRLREAHRIGDEVEAGIRRLREVKWVINIHLDPVDDSKAERLREVKR